MLEGRQFDKWKTAADVMEWYIYGAETRYKQLDAKGIEGQIDFSNNGMYEDDSFGHPTMLKMRFPLPSSFSRISQKNEILVLMLIS